MVPAFVVEHNKLGRFSEQRELGKQLYYCNLAAVSFHKEYKGLHS